MVRNRRPPPDGPTPDQIKFMADELSKRLADTGQIIEGGWVGFKLIVIPPTAPQVQHDEMRKAFFAGAQHLFTSIMNILEPGAEPTDKDLNRMSMIASELQAFEQQMKRQHADAIPPHLRAKDDPLNS